MSIRQLWEKNRELCIVVIYVLIAFFLWAIEPVTQLTRGETLIITLALGLLDVQFVFISRVLRRLDQVLQRTGASELDWRDDIRRMTDGQLNELTLSAVCGKSSLYFAKVRTMASEGKYLTDKSEVYGEITMYCQTLRDLKGELMAVSAFNIDDFVNYPDAGYYLSANADLMHQGKTVRRIFILDPEDLDRTDFRHMLQIHDQQLTPHKADITEAKDSGVKWVLRRHAKENADQDFALFYPYVIVRQATIGSKLDVSQIKVELDEAARVFESLWNDPNSKHVSQLPSTQRKSK